MRKLILLFALIITVAAIAEESEPCPPRWNYENQDNWGSLDPNWKACSSGLLQSPINLTQMTSWQDNTLPWLDAQRYPTSATVNVSNTSRALKVYPTTTVEILRNNVPYKLVEFHFHVPKEHTANSAGAEAELHLVHKSADGKETVVVAVFISPGAANAEIQKLISNVPAACDRPIPTTGVNLTRLLPGTLNRYFTYIGSLTTPACDEGLIWIILNDGITATQDQINGLKVISNNARRPQPRIRWRSVG